MYQTGDYVYPADLPRRLLCRVAEAESWGTFQILKLRPLEGPWPPGTHLIRLDEGVRAARVRASLLSEADSLRSTANGASPRIEDTVE